MGEPESVFARITTNSLTSTSSYKKCLKIEARPAIARSAEKPASANSSRCNGEGKAFATVSPSADLASAATVVGIA
jgi:hypothetical protein